MTYTPTEQANIGLIQRMMALEEAQDWDAVYELIAPDCVYHVNATDRNGQEEMRQRDAQTLSTFSSPRRAILDMAADGERVMWRWRVDATLTSNGNPVSWEACSWARVEGGRLAEAWVYFDSASIQRQMSAQ